jgi:hypothetical protein
MVSLFGQSVILGMVVPTNPEEGSFRHAVELYMAWSSRVQLILIEREKIHRKLLNGLEKYRDDVSERLAWAMAQIKKKRDASRADLIALFTGVFFLVHNQRCLGAPFYDCLLRAEKTSARANPPTDSSLLTPNFRIGRVDMFSVTGVNEEFWSHYKERRDDGERGKSFLTTLGELERNLSCMEGFSTALATTQTQLIAAVKSKAKDKYDAELGNLCSTDLDFYKLVIKEYAKNLAMDQNHRH